MTDDNRLLALIHALKELRDSGEKMPPDNGWAGESTRATGLN